MNKLIADVLQDLHQEKKTGALFITVAQSREFLLRFWLAEGEMLRFSYGPLRGQDCLDLLDSYDFGKAVFFEGMTCRLGTDDQGPGMPHVIAAFRNFGKTIEVLQSQWWPGQKVAPLLRNDERESPGTTNTDAVPGAPQDRAAGGLPEKQISRMEWTPGLPIDAPLIDDQHKELFKQIDALVKAWAGGRGASEAETMIRFLEEHILTHFETEEQCMAKYAYADRLAHRTQHEMFAQSFGELKTRYYHQGADDDLISDMIDFTMRWFRDHIRYADRAFGLYLNVKMYDWGEVA